MERKKHGSGRATAFRYFEYPLKFNNKLKKKSRITKNGEQEELWAPWPQTATLAFKSLEALFQ
jgi:hypothetical protein